MNDALGEMSEPIHVLPVNDLREHEDESGPDCWCEPRVEIIADTLLVIHDALDGRD